MEKLKETQLETVENQNNQTPNLFYKKISSFFQSLEQPWTLDDSGVIDSFDKYELIGSVCYMIGLDFTNQSVYEKARVNAIQERLEKNGINIESIRRLADNIEIAHINDINDILTELNETVKSEMLEQVNTIFSTSAVKIFESIIKKVIRNSNIPVKYSMSLNKILSTPLTFDDILKLNTLINKEIQFIGNIGQKAILELYRLPIYKDLLAESVERFDKQKFALVYYDSILSVAECLKRIGIENFITLLTIKPDIIDFDKINQEILEKKTKEKVEPTVEDVEDTFIPTPSDIANKMMEENPIQFIYTIVCEYAGKNLLTADAMYSTVENIAKDAEYGQHIYKYMKVKKDFKCSESELNKVPAKLYSELSDILTTKLNDYREQYKIKANVLFEQIPENKINRIITLCNETISELVLESENQKQYLLSQLIENNISTFNHLQQTMSLIEECNIVGSSYKKYVDLYEYVERETEISEIIKDSNALPELENIISFLLEFQVWCKKILAFVEIPSLGQKN